MSPVDGWAGPGRWGLRTPAWGNCAPSALPARGRGGAAWGEGGAAALDSVQSAWKSQAEGWASVNNSCKSPIQASV